MQPGRIRTVARARRHTGAIWLVCAGALLAVLAPPPVGARATRATERPAVVVPKEALLIGDSVMAAMNYSYAAPANALLAARHSYVLDAAGCRKLISTSCRILPNPAPTNAITVLKARAGQFNRALVVAVGYNDSTTGAAGLGAAVDTLVAEARRQGITHVIWLTYRVAGSSGNRARFQAHNATLRAKTAVHPELRLADWASVSAGLPSSWFSADGIHLGGSAATAMADLIADTLDALPPVVPPPPPDRCSPANWIGEQPLATPPVPVNGANGGLHLLPAPVRFADTRGRTGKLGANRVLPILVGGVAGVPTDAVAAVVTLTAVRPCAQLALTAFPCHGGVPTASMLNAPAATTVANAAVVRLGAGALCIWAAQPTDVIVDVAGWVGPGGGLSQPLTAPRLLDTRSGTTQALATPQLRLVAGQHLTLDLATATVGGGDPLVAADAAAVSLNLTAYSPAGAGFLSVQPGACTVAVPATSNLNTVAGRDATGSATVGVPGGQFCVYTSVATDLAVDVQAVHGAAGTAITPAEPVRLADTRSATAVAPGAPLQIDLAAPPSGAALAMPDGTSGAVLDLVAIAPAAGVAVSVAGCAAGAPPVAQLVAAAGVTTANRVIVAVDAGPLCVYADAAVHVVVDAEAWLAVLPPV
ncbi:MAG: hypothetical protein Q7V88_19790 [Actinomycetota bacterium]|nr:hypothetical protein [Actinomycetota bacterium]